MKKITQKKLAGKLGMKNSGVSRFLRCRYRINYDRAAEISKAHGIPVKALQSRDPDVLVPALEKVFGEINFGKGRVKKEDLEG